MTIDISSGTIFRIVFILLGLWFLFLIADILLVLFAAIVVAAAIEPIANYAQKYKVPRPLSVTVVYLLAILILMGVAGMMVEPLQQQIRQLVQAVPTIMNTLHDVLVFIPQLNEQEFINTIQQGVTQFGDNLTRLSFNIFQQTRVVIAGIAAFLFVFVLTFYLVVEKDALKKFIRIVTPVEHQPFMVRTVDRAQKQVGRWLLAQVVLGLIIGVVVGLGLWIIGVPYALLLGLLAGILEIIPYIGPIIAGVLGVVIGFSQSLILGLVVLGFYILVQQFENHILVPNVMRRAVGLHPLATIIAILLGARLAGTVGLILAVPMATVIAVLFSDIISVRDVEEEIAG